MEKVALWWDMDSCPLPSHMDPFVVRWMANSLLEKFNIRGSGVGHQFSAYKYPSAKEDDIELGQTMVNSGVSLKLVQPALTGNNNEIEKMIMADVLLWAIDMPPPGDIVFIVGNVDFSYVVRKLRERSYNVFLVCASVTQIPHGMLSAANDCLGWLTFLSLLEHNEEKLQFPNNVQGWGPENYQDFSNVHPGSPSTVSSKDWEEYQSKSSFGYIQENSSIGEPAFNIGWDWNSSQFGMPPLNDAVAATMQQPQGPGFQGHGNKGSENSSTGQSAFNDGWDWDSSQFSIPSLNDTVQPRGPGFQGHGNKSTEKPRDPAGNKHRNRKPSTTTGSNKKLGSMHDFKKWLRQVVNSKENQNGYNFSQIRMDFERATGKKLDFLFLGFPKVINLIEQCKDIAELKEVKKGCHLAFPVKKNKPNPAKTTRPSPNPNPNLNPNPNRNPNPGPNPNPYTNPNPNPYTNPNPNPNPNPNSNPMKGKSENSPFGLNPNPSTQPDLEPNLTQKPKLEAEEEQKSMPKASLGDFHVFLLDMVSSGEFSQGFLMSNLRAKFESVSGKCLDIPHLGFKKLINLVEVYGSLVSVDKTGPGPVRVYPAGFVTETIPNSNLSRKSEEISINAVNHIAKQEANVEVDCPFTGGSDQKSEYKSWKDNISHEHLSYQISELAVGESKWQSMGLNSLPSMSFIPTEPTCTGFQGYGNMLDSSGTTQGSQVSEWEGQFSNMVSKPSCHADSHPLEGSEYVELLSSLQREGNVPIGNSANCEALQNMVENKRVCKEAITTQGSQVSEWEDQFSNIVSKPSCHADSHPLEGSESVKLLSSSQRDGNIPSGNSANSEALQNMVESKRVCKEAITVSETATYQNSSWGISFGNFVSSQLEAPFMQSEVSCNIPVSPLQSLPQETAVFSKGLKEDTSLECKQNAKSAVNEETNVHSVVSPAESIMQVAGRGLKTICESMWKKSQ